MTHKHSNLASFAKYLSRENSVRENMLALLVRHILHDQFATSYCVCLLLGQIGFPLSNLKSHGPARIVSTELDSATITLGLDAGCDALLIVLAKDEYPQTIKNLVAATKKSEQRKCRKIILITEDEQQNIENQLLSFPELYHFPNFVLGIFAANKSMFWKQSFSGITKKEQQTPVLVDVWEKGVFEHKREFFPEEWKNLNGRVLKMATFNYPPYSIIEGTHWDGTEMRLAIELARKLNFTWELVTDSHQWGQIFENSTGDGILGNVAGDKADFGFGALYLWYYEYQFLDFTVPYIRTGITCLAPRPAPLSGLMAPALPFSRAVWLAVAASTGAGTLLLWLLFRRRRQQDLLAPENGPLDCAILMVGFMIMVPASNVPRGVLRLCLNCFLIQGLLMATCYSSSLVSFMTVPRFEQPIDTAKHLVDKKYAWAANHEAWAFSLREATDAVFGSVYKLFTVLNEEDQQKSALKGRKVAFAVERLPSGQLAVNPMLSDAFDKLRLMNEDLYWEMVVSVVAKGSPLTAPANELALRLLESGILLHWEANAAHKWDQTALKHIHTVQGPTRLTKSHLAGVFVLWGSALLISTAVFVFEKFYAHQQDFKL